MAKDALQGQATETVGQNGRNGIADPVVQLPTNDGGFLAQLSGNQFFSAVSGMAAPINLKQPLIGLLGIGSRWLWCSPRRGPERFASWRKPCQKTSAGGPRDQRER